LAESATHRRVGVWDRERSDEATSPIRWLLDDPRRNVEHAFVPRGSAQPVAVLVEVRDARVRCSLLDLDSGAETCLPDIPGNLTPLRPLGGREWVGEYYSSTQPADLVRFSLDDIRPAAFVSLTRVWERTALRPQ